MALSLDLLASKQSLYFIQHLGGIFGLSAKDGVIENKIWYTTAQTNAIVENVLLCIEPSSESLI